VAIRGARVLVVGACSARGHAVVEAFLALGAQVIAADRLRTQLEELRAELRQHERLWVAETDPDDPGALAALFADVAREPLDAALLLVAVTPETGLRAPPRCAAFVRTALHALGPHGRVRVVLLIEPASEALDEADFIALDSFLANADSEAQEAGLAVCALRDPSLQQVLTAADPAHPAPHGLLG
jgi:NAD(P)-dependent dehydrogenase (short-subunit alcohol dehydrogenase family)